MGSKGIKREAKLIGQAEASWKIWNSERRLKFSKNPHGKFSFEKSRAEKSFQKT